MPQFQALYDLGKAQDSYDLDVLTQHRVNRFQQSISNNPYFFNGPFSGVAVQPAAYTFIYRFMANKSAEYPEGRLTGDVLKSFFSITGTDGNFKYTPGYERIPNNWYKRNAADAYTIPYYSLDLDTMALKYPQFLSIGGNTGTVNSFVGLEPTSLTNGVYNAATLTQGNNALCYAFQVGAQSLPDLLQGVFTNPTTALNTLDGLFSKAASSLGCPQLNSVDQSQYDRYPGYAKLKSNGQY